MIQLNEEYADLVAMTRLLLLQEHSRNDWIMTDSATYEYFKHHAIKKKTEATPLPMSLKPKQTPTPPPTAATRSPQPKIIPKKPTTFIELQSLPPPPIHDFSDIRNILTKKFPQQTILDQIPGDEQAKETRQRWQQHHSAPDCATIPKDIPIKHQLFLQNTSKAVQICYNTVTAISVQKLNPSNGYRLTISLKENKKEEVIPLEISNIEAFFKDPLLKAKLWEEIGVKLRR